MIREYASLDGLGVTLNANVDGTTPQEFIIGGDKNIEVNGLIIFVRDATVADGAYGAVTALTNGITIELQDSEGNVLVDALGGLPLKVNRDFYRVSPKIERGDDWLSAFMVFDDRIVLSSGKQLVITISDDLSGLDEHYFFATGKYISG